jgi:uncharacterized membrane protein
MCVCASASVLKKPYAETHITDECPRDMFRKLIFSEKLGRKTMMAIILIAVVIKMYQIFTSLSTWNERNSM